MIPIMGTLLRKLLANIREICWLVIMADETDILHHELLAISIQWVNNIYKVQDFIGMVHAHIIIHFNCRHSEYISALYPSVELLLTSRI